jgi:predicted amidohydrolase YtcJ
MDRMSMLKKIARGMLADLVELDRNPLKVKPDEIKDIQVVRTIKRGKTVYAKSP